MRGPRVSGLCPVLESHFPGAVLWDSRQGRHSPCRDPQLQQRSKEQLGVAFSFPQHTRLPTFSWHALKNRPWHLGEHCWKMCGPYASLTCSRVGEKLVQHSLAPAIFLKKKNKFLNILPTNWILEHFRGLNKPPSACSLFYYALFGPLKEEEPEDVRNSLAASGIIRVKSRQISWFLYSFLYQNHILLCRQPWGCLTSMCTNLPWDH